MARFTLIVTSVVVCMTSVVVCMSWTSKSRQRSYHVSNLEHGENQYKWIQPCEDEHPKCSGFKKLCKDYKVVQHKCKETCGKCRAHMAPIDCSKTSWGCCWDNVTVAEGPNYKGCALCEDKYSECKHFVDQCPYRHDLRLMCPVTCQVGCKQCLDNPYQADVCILYKKYNFCTISPDLMQKMCARTCGFC